VDGQVADSTAPPASNVVYFSVDGVAADKVITGAAQQNVKLGYGRNNDIRVLTHLDAPRDKLMRAIDVIQNVVQTVGATKA
jgi:hypothetical protein